MASERTTTKKRWQDVPMPAALAKRPRDVHGYPITFVTVVENGRPDFTTVDGRQVVSCIKGYLCGLCGTSLGVRREAQIAFIGGPSAIEQLAFLDPPMHPECAAYAMEVCPHLATPTARYKKQPERPGREVISIVSADRPDKFGLLTCTDYEVQLYEGHVIFFISGMVLGVDWQKGVA